MSEASCRADYGGDLPDWDDDGVPVLGHFYVVGGHDLDGTDDGPAIDDNHPHLFGRCRDLSKSCPEREHVATLLDTSRCASLHRPNRRIEHDLDQILAPVDTGEVRPCVDDSPRKGVGACLGAHPLPSVYQFEDSSGEVEAPPPKQLGQLLVLRRLLQPLPPDAVTKVRLHIPIRCFFHLLSRSRHFLQFRR